LIRGHPRFEEKWQRRVLEELNEADIAVVDVSVPSVNVLWEIKQCYDLLPAHRVIFVGNADEILDASTVREFYYISYSLPVAFANHPGFVERVHAKLNASMEGHLKSLMDGLMSFEDFNRHNGPPCLAPYFTDKAGRQWLEAALHGFMSRIIEIETTERHRQEGTVHVRPASAVAAAFARFGGGHPPADLQSSAPARVALSKLQVGDRVLHKFLGEGVVESVENESTGDLKVAFLGRPAPYSMNTTYLTLIDR
jgi:hypothetical protein